MYNKTYRSKTREYKLHDKRNLNSALPHHGQLQKTGKDPLLSNDLHLMSTKLYTFSPNVSFFHQKKKNSRKKRRKQTSSWPQTGKSSIPKTKNIAAQWIDMKFGFQLSNMCRLAIIGVFWLLVLSLFSVSVYCLMIGSYLIYICWVMGDRGSLLSTRDSRMRL